mgnify:CR=1 FL=1
MKKFTQDHTFKADNYDEFKKIMETSRGFISAHWCENADCEAQIKTDTKATTRCMPLDQPIGKGKCIVCGKEAERKVYFARSY